MLNKQGDRLINSRNWSELVKPDKIKLIKLHNEDEDKDEEYGI